MNPRRVLVTGGQRSGKSGHAERLLADEPRVRYLAPGPVPDPATDPEWAARIDAHRTRRPGHWTTVETTDLSSALESGGDAVLVDCLGTWLTAVLDDLGAWDAARDQWQAQLQARADALVAVWSELSVPAVAVTNEVGLGLVSEHRSGRIFADQLGRLNQQIAAVSDEVHLVVAGRVLRL